MVVPVRKRSQSRQCMASAAAAMALLAVSGCSFLEDRSERYVTAPVGQPLKTVDERQRNRIGEAYPIREIENADTGRMYPDELPVPPDMTSDILEQNYLVEELDDQAWLLVNELPGQVWPGVTSYMNERGFGVAFDNPALGLVQSELANYSRQARSLLGMSDTAGSESLVVVQARVAPGVRRKSTEIQLRPRIVTNNPERLFGWQSVAADLAMEKTLLADLADFLQAREGTKSYSRAALGITSEPLVNLVTEDDLPVAIRMDLDYGRAWSEVRRALGDASVDVVDLDRSSGRFFVDYRSSEERDPGMFSWFSDKAEAEYTFDVQLVQQEGFVLVTTGRAPAYQGIDRSTLLLSQLFDHLY
ncbi:outer membrane protein assembly factor BamC [Marinobacter zhejiangensis]|uniref:Beta-barrel assembly machine subunit BamC n=1 Tax=Marinobacter zhejiangensis TaxID=488535 RepID=A0A1I4RLA8_9GAMM|nr:outer membrane protein assembly factor BamC [Marinobacter zhejiangensis]SFM53028.1 Beta-barrel assembly machine subunit BamC [Marinobacter zhejiangensis]